MFGLTLSTPGLLGARYSYIMLDTSCLNVNTLYFRAQRRQSGRCETVTASKWRCPRQLFHNGQNHPRILTVPAISREQKATREGIERTFQNSGRQALRMQEIDALAAASGSAKAQALGRKYSRVVYDLARSGNHTESWKIFTKLKSHGASISYNAHHQLIVACLKVNEVDRAIEVFDAIAECGKEANVITTCALISGLLQSSSRRHSEANLPKALELWSGLRVMARGAKTPLPERAMHTGVHALCRAGRPSEALKLVEELNNRGERPGVQVYNMIISGYANQKNIDAATSMLETMALRGVVPNVVSYNSLVSCLCRAGRAAQAHNIVQMAIRRGVVVDEWAWSAMIQAHIENENLSAVRQILKDMYSHGVKPGPTILTQILHSVRLERSTRAAKRAAIRVWKLLKALDAPLTVESYNAMLAVTLRDDPEFAAHAMGAIDEMRQKGLPLRTDTLNTVMKAALDNSDFYQAVTLFTQLREAGLQPNSITFTTLMKAHQRAGNLNSAQATFATAQQQGQANIVATNAFVDVLVDSGELNLASQVLEQLVTRIGVWGRDIKILLPGFGALASGYCQERRCGDAVATVRRFNELGGVPDKRMYDTVLTACLTVGEVGYAKQIVRAMQLSGVEVDLQRYNQVTDWALQRNSASTKIVALERFKFWLGIPNEYYNDED